MVIDTAAFFNKSRLLRERKNFSASFH
jgi:hypothetical protein